jgi:hypothetical protein
LTRNDVMVVPSLRPAPSTLCHYPQQKRSSIWETPLPLGHGQNVAVFPLTAAAPQLPGPDPHFDQPSRA